MKIKRRFGGKIFSYLQKICNDINNKILLFQKVYLQTPFPRKHIFYEKKIYDVPLPAQPIYKKLGFLGLILDPFTSYFSDKIKRENEEIKKIYELELYAWNQGKELHDHKETLF